jgi:hypothetical protein
MPERGEEIPLARKNASAEKKAAKDYGYCSVCQKTVLMSEGRVLDHQLPSGVTCLGSGGERFTGLQYKCSVYGAVKPVRDSVTPLTRKSDGEWAGRRHPAEPGLVVLVWFWGYAAVSVMTALPSRMAMCWPVSACSWLARSRARRCLLMRDS